MEYDRSVKTVIFELLAEIPELLRSEFSLARAEISEGVSTMRTGIGFAAAGALLLIVAVLALAEAAIGGLMAAGFGLGIASVIVAGVCLVVGLIVVRAGTRRLRLRNLAPQKTVRQIERDVQLTRHQVQTP